MVHVRATECCLRMPSRDHWHSYRGLGKTFVFFYTNTKAHPVSFIPCPGVFQAGYLLASGAEFKEFPGLGITTVCTTLNRVCEERLPFCKTKHSTNVREEKIH